MLVIYTKSLVLSHLLETNTLEEMNINAGNLYYVFGLKSLA